MPDRAAPVVNRRSAPFWHGGAAGELRIARCQQCRFWLHPPEPVCAKCRGTDIVVEAVSGRGTVWSFTVNRYPWVPGFEPPYVIAEVELEEQVGLRLLTTIVDCDHVTIGMPVAVRFELAGDVWIPVFAP
jgi:uncharacterized OB-fold protein